MFKKGQKWKMRGGKIVTIKRVTDTKENMWPYCLDFEGDHFGSYTSEGFIWDNHSKDPEDLIELIQELHDI